MKIIQTFWTGNPAKRSIDIKAGWPTCEYHWMSWALSCLQARSLFAEVELVTDDFGKEILVDQLGLPYTSVSTALEGVLQDYPPQVWALAKIFSYSIQTAPFLHIDGDVFLWEKPGQRIMEAGIIAQNLEKDLVLYKAALDGINEISSDLPLIYQRGYYTNKTIYSGNAGLIGGNDLAFFDIYCREAFQFIDAIKGDLGKINPVNLSHLNFLFEQYALYQIASRENRAITFYLEEVIETPVYEDLIRFQDRPAVKMIHPVGGFKKYRHMCDHLAKSLRVTYPSYYYTIVDRVRKDGAAMTNKIYYSIRPGGSELEGSAIANPFAVHERTREALALWNAGADLSSLEEGKEKELILDLQQLERQKEGMFERIFTQSNGLAAAYENEALVYTHLQKAFSLDRSALFQLPIAVKEDTLRVELGWAWPYADEAEIKSLLEKNRGEDRSLNKVVLVPSIVRVTINEYYLDQFDALLVETVSSGFYTIDGLTAEIKQYFDADEIATDPTGFEKLVIDTLKRLCYAGVLNILL